MSESTALISARMRGCQRGLPPERPATRLLGCEGAPDARAAPGRRGVRRSVERRGSGRRGEAAAGGVDPSVNLNAISVGEILRRWFVQTLFVISSVFAQPMPGTEEVA